MGTHQVASELMKQIKCVCVPSPSTRTLSNVACISCDCTGLCKWAAIVRRRVCIFVVCASMPIVQLCFISCQKGAAEGWLSFRQPTKARGQPAQTYLLCNFVVLYRYTLILRSPNRHSQWLSSGVALRLCGHVAMWL